MATLFKRVVATGSAAGSVVYTVPVGSTVVIIGFIMANVSGALVNIGATVAGKHLAKDIPLPHGSSVGLLDGKVVLEAGDEVTEICSTDGGVDIVFSYMEQTSD